MDMSIEGLDKSIFYGLREFIVWVATIVSVSSIVVIAYFYFTGRFNKDDTDPVDGRSGMVAYIDNRTGCHYLGTQYGGMTPRLDKQGLISKA